jgi:acyl-CoA thioesterase
MSGTATKPSARTDAPTARLWRSSGAGLVRGAIYDADGQLAATVMQEVPVRPLTGG